MSLFAMIDYGLLVIFFICFIGLVLLSTHPHQQQSVASVVIPSPRESPAAYLFLVVLFLLLIMLTVLTQKGHERSNAFG